MKENDFEQALAWAERAPIFAAKRHDTGEVEILVGKVAFARGELERAKERFLISTAKSEGRAFEGEDKRYKQLMG